MANTTPCLVYDVWLSDILKKDVFRIASDMSTTLSDSSINGLGEAIAKSSVFLYSKIPTTSVESAQFLERKGFYLVDTNVTFEKDLITSAPLEISETSYSVRDATPSDESQLVALARQSFSQTRFHLDSRISADCANTIKAEWVRNFFKGKRGNRMVVAVQDGKICGFLQLLFSEENVLTIDLIGVDAEHRRKNIARNMILFAEKPRNKFEKMRVGTQIVNIGSIRLYEGLGFKLVSSEYVFHFHA